MNLNEAIKGSCNIFFYNLMQKIDFDDWSNASKQFGFGMKTEIDLPQENKGLVPTKNYMNEFYKDKGGWSKGHLLNLSIGQGEVSVTPIQVIQLINSIANNGVLYTPHLNIRYNSKKTNISYNENVWSILKQAMYDAVNSDGGTAYNARIDTKRGIAYGKTGTAQVCSNCDIEPHGWFAGFIKLNNGKQYTICIIIENGGKGSNKPTRIAKDIFQYIIELDNV
jgi:penicillin-binding protein 2